jgi:RIO-like serine/threonine protein kinase
VSTSNITPELEKTILEAFDAIHALGVLHCDARRENILVGKEGKEVWIIDFEFSLIVKEDAKREEMFAAERTHVMQLLVDTRTNKPAEMVA